MRHEWWSLSASEREVYHASFRFLGERLEEAETIQWALSLGPNEKAKRLAIIDLIRKRRTNKLSRPWLETWHLIIENWSRPAVERNGHTEVYQVSERLKSEEYTKGVVSAIVELVTPSLRIRMLTEVRGGRRKGLRKVRSIEDLISCTLTSGRLIEVDELKLGEIGDKGFLLSLASGLDDLIISSLDLARRVGWDGEHNYWIIGQMHRAYYVYEKNENGREHEPDEFADGIVPAVKLLYEVLARLADVDLASAICFVARWKAGGSQIHLRLLAALYRDSRLASEDRLNTFLMQLDDLQFWNLENYPEVAELRAKRFNDLGDETKVTILKRIKKGPPRSNYHRSMDKNQFQKARKYCAAREMKRIQLAGGGLPEKVTSWLSSRLTEHPELKEMNTIDADFPEGVKTQWVAPRPDPRFDSIAGEERLSLLEAGMNKRRSWFEDEGNASDWIQAPENSFKLISDFESLDDAGSKYPKIWEKFGWAHAPAESSGNNDDRDNLSEVSRVIGLLKKLENDAVVEAIGGISSWLNRWSKLLGPATDWIAVWRKIWPYAVAATNAVEGKDEVDLETTGGVVENKEPLRLDTLNTPAGKLIWVFLMALNEEEAPFAAEQPLRQIRNDIFSSSERSLLIAQHCCVEFLDYFLTSDREWAEEHLVKPIKAQDSKSVVLWGAISRRMRRKEALSIIGDEMISRTLDMRLGREVRSRFLDNMVVSCLHAYWREEEAPVHRSKVQQMIRSVEDEVRVSGAEILQRFLRDSANPTKNTEMPTPSLEELYSRAVRPFLMEVWPQERSLATPGVSQAFADLPISTGNQFADAVGVIERFLVPFDCWSLGDYGFYRAGRDELALELIDSADKAEAFLRLLDRTIGAHEGAIVPHELTYAIEKIRQISPRLSGQQAFRRLEAATRR
ncbi:hypothetical protein SAMN02745165_02881 [Malonomonas rubra DSM 5091]|uniref:Uncharacterized protein n=1 Tax=Malonomonas rubra DSM 5091 TaxID=1122189 RepID=A0A1M6L682_MALRU|nr:hypothetical protein [Malonomonas rubra]SHJ66559.1 hypothetical protein SAMN02745165_02881 [Malonomonas rubra DSM 5091]